MTDDRIIRTLPADLLTPVGAYLLLREALGTPAFLLESVERGEQVGRHSFLAAGCETTDSLEEAMISARARAMAAGMVFCHPYDDVDVVADHSGHDRAAGQDALVVTRGWHRVHSVSVSSV